MSWLYFINDVLQILGSDMKRSYFRKCVLVLALLGLGFAGLAQAGDEPPEVMVQRLAGGILDAIVNDKSIGRGDLLSAVNVVNASLMPNVNIQRMTASSVGSSWPDASPEQQARLQDEFKVLVARTYAGALRQTVGKTIVVKSINASPDGTDVLIRTETQGGGDSISLAYRLEKTPGKGAGWRIYNINILGVWLAETYKVQFAKQLSENGVSGLIVALAERNNANLGVTPNNRDDPKVMSQQSQLAQRPQGVPSDIGQTSRASEDREALTKSCTAESEVLLGRGTRESQRIMSTTGDARSGLLAMASNLKQIISLYQGRCRPANNATSQLAQAAKMMFDISLACAQGGAGSDCDQLRSDAQAANRVQREGGSVLSSDNVTPSNTNSNVPNGNRLADVDPSRSASTSGDASNNPAGTRIVWDGTLTNCVLYKPRPRKSDSSAQWFEITNTCNTPINVWHDDAGTGSYGSMSPLRPGQTSSSWWSIDRVSKLNYVACRQKTVNNDDVYLNKKMLNCYFNNKIRN